MRDLGAKKLPQALKKAQLGVKSYPNVVDFHAIAGFVLTEMGRYKQSIPHFVEASRLKPDDPQFAENLANALMQTGRLDRALALAEQKLERFPGNRELARVIEEITTKGTNWREIIGHVSKRLEADPDNARLLLMRARAFGEIDFLEDATRDISRAYALAPDNALIAVRKAVDLIEAGEFEESSRILWSVLKSDEGNAQALYLLSTVSNDIQIFELLRKTEDALTRQQGVSVELEFAKAHLVARRDGLENAMPLYAQGNATQQASQPYDQTAEEEKFTRTQSVCPANQPPPVAEGELHPMPIFVIGQPRSGTTLMEVMLSALPGVTGCGELLLGSDLTRALIEAGKVFDAPAADRIAQDYRRLMPPLPEATTAFVDKMPHNYQRLGFLMSAFPNAKVIHMLRDPRDVGLSAWIKLFPSHGMRYASDLNAMAAAANLYRRYMSHWSGLFGARILTVSYEDLVSDPAAQSKAIADFCGLEWSEAMLRPQETSRQVRTASADQVRKGISPSSIGGWRQVADHIRPMLDGLDPELWPEYDLRDTG